MSLSRVTGLFVLATFLNCLAVAWPTYVHLHNKDRLDQADKMAELIDMHGMPPSEVVAVREQARFEQRLINLYPADVVSQLSTYPRIQVEGAILLMMTVAFIVFTVTVAASRMMTRDMRLFGYVPLALFGASLVVHALTALAARWTGESLANVVAVGLSFALAQSLVAAIYAVGFTALIVGMPRFRILACVFLAWTFWALRPVARLAMPERAAAMLPGGLVSYFWTGRAVDFLTGFGLALTWCGLLLVGFWLSRRTAHPVRVPMAA